MKAEKAVLNWSSGKDAALAYFNLLKEERYEIACLLTTLSAEHERVFMHGVRASLLEAQAQKIGLPLIKIPLAASPDDGLYKAAMLQTFSGLKQQGISVAAYGDIFLDDLRAYREAQLATAGIKGIFPLWKKDTRLMVKEIIHAGIDAIVVCVNARVLSKEWLGRKIDESFLRDLPGNVDPCGENGEFHTFVYNAPFFSSPIDIIFGDTVHRQYATGNKDNGWDTGFYFLDVISG